ncbi:MAG: 30S ribosomal protein S4e [Fervidicoccaceae archaeon]
MTRMGGSKHLRSYEAPTFWPISVKERHWTIKPIPGPHPIRRSMPLGILLRDVLKLATTGREVRKALSKGLVKIDGRVRKDYRFPLGFMDVIEIVPAKKFYRLIPDERAFMKPIEINEEDSKLKPLRIENKTTVKGGLIQLNLFDGSNILLPKEGELPFKEEVTTLSTVLLSIPDKKIIDYFPLAEGMYAIIVGGKNIGASGKIVEIKKGERKKMSLVTMKRGDGSLVQTSLDKIYVIGKENPAIKIE